MIKKEENLFKHLREPKNLNDLMDMLLNITYDYGNPKAWRGQSNINWSLDSGAVRRIKTKLNVKEENLNEKLKQYELELLNRARLQGHGVDKGVKISDFELLAKIQHFGGATRLLDFSRNAFIALWFACQGHPNETGILFGLNTVDGHRLEYKELDTDFHDIIESVGNKIIIWEPEHLYKRMQIQQSYFITSKYNNLKWTSLMLEEESEVSTDVIKIVLLPKIKEELRRQFDTLFGYNENVLFPEIDGFARFNSALKPFEYDFFEKY